MEEHSFQHRMARCVAIHTNERCNVLIQAVGRIIGIEVMQNNQSADCASTEGNDTNWNWSQIVSIHEQKYQSYPHIDNNIGSHLSGSIIHCE